MTNTPDTFYVSHVKRLLDVAGGVALLVLTAPLQAVTSMAVVIEDGWPVFFHQDRGGQWGRTFRLHKVRTMYNGTEAAAGAFPTSNMVTNVGVFLRRYSLDEVPQLINIIRGEMSFVGPRPPLVSHVGRYTNRQRTRLNVRPGLTGLAQVRFRNNAPWSRRIESDIEYVSAISFRLDTKIILKTILQVLSGRDQLVGQTPADVDDLGPAVANIVPSRPGPDST